MDGVVGVGRSAPKAGALQAALRPDTMQVEDSTVLLGFPLSDLNSDCARTVQISLAFKLLCTIVRGPNH